MIHCFVKRSDCDILHAKIDLLFGRNVLFTKKMKTVNKPVLKKDELLGLQEVQKWSEILLFTVPARSYTHNM